MSGEKAFERWNPVQRVETVLISVLSLLDDAEISSPANVDAGVLLRKDPEGYKARVLKETEESKRDIPEGFVMPTHETAFAKRAADDDDFQMNWEDSDVESFGGSDSDVDFDDEEAESGTDGDDDEMEDDDD